MDPTANSLSTQSGIAAEDLNAAINLRLALLGLPLAAGADEAPMTRLMEPILARQRELSRRLSDRLCPADSRI